MPRSINIEIMRLKPTKKTAIVMAILALIIGCLIAGLPGAQAQYAENDADRHVLYFDKTNDVGLSITENAFWNNNKDGLEFQLADFEANKGLLKEKEPIISNTSGDCYMRACVRVVDSNGEPMSADAMYKILSNLWYDSASFLPVDTKDQTTIQLLP